MTDYEPRQWITGLGCGLVVPTAIFGTMLLVEDHVPTLQATTEFLGWCTLCILVAAAISALLRRQIGMKVAAIGAGVAFLALVVGEAHPNTPDIVKDVFTTALQGLGILGVIAGMWLIVRVRRSHAVD